MARKKQKTLVLFPDVFYCAERLSNDQFGVLMRSVFAYRFEGVIYDGEDIAIDIAFRSVKDQIDRYIEVCEINRGNVVNSNTEKGKTERNEIPRNRTKKEKEEGNTPPIPYHSPIPYHNPVDNKADKPPTSARFCPPSVDDVKSYCIEKGYNIDPQRFVDYYESIGWMVGKNKMKSWQAAVRTWASKEQEKVQPVEKKKPSIADAFPPIRDL